jgi:hypothetical protein
MILAGELFPCDGQLGSNSTCLLSYKERSRKNTSPTVGIVLAANLIGQESQDLSLNGFSNLKLVCRIYLIAQAYS